MITPNFRTCTCMCIVTYPRKPPARCRYCDQSRWQSTPAVWTVSAQDTTLLPWREPWWTQSSCQWRRTCSASHSDGVARTHRHHSRRSDSPASGPWSQSVLVTPGLYINYTRHNRSTKIPLNYHQYRIGIPGVRQLTNHAALEKSKWYILSTNRRTD